MKEEILKPKQYKKKGSPNFIIVAPNTWMNDDVDVDWFVDITTYSNKTKKEKEVMTVTKKDLPGHLRMYFKEGWEETEYVDIFSKDDETNDKT